MIEFVLKELQDKNIIEAGQKSAIEGYEKNKLFSVNREIKAMLYLGVVLLNIGLGWLIYENIDSIGHQAIIAGIAAITAFSFWYSFRHNKPFSLEEVKNESPFFTYVLLLGCLTFLILEGYLQYQYNVFGERYGLATFIPTILFFPTAYYFDHRGVLSLAITSLASWLGITVTPIQLLENGMGQNNLIYTGLLLGLLLCGAVYFSEKKNIKKHFSFTYLNFGANILFLASLSGLIIIENYIFFPLIIILVIVFVKYAVTRQSFYFLTLALIYGYWSLSYLIIKIDILSSTLILYYFIITSIMLIVFLIKFIKTLKVKIQNEQIKNIENDSL